MSFDQEVWLYQNSMRHKTLKGFPEALSPSGIRNATPRLSGAIEGARFQEDVLAPATLDPFLPRPGKPLNPFMTPNNMMKDMTHMKIYNGIPGGGLGSMIA